jgi:hypothetical protein
MNLPYVALRATTYSRSLHLNKCTSFECITATIYILKSVTEVALFCSCLQSGPAYFIHNPMNPLKPFAERIDKTIHAIDEALFEKDYRGQRSVTPKVIDLSIVSAISATGIGAEAAALRLADRPTTVPNALGRASLHAVALGSVYVLGAALKVPE